MRHIAFVIVALIWCAPAFAQAQLNVAMDRLGIADMIDVMRDEGLDYAQNLNDELLGGQGGAVWHKQIDAIYDPQKMSETVRTALSELSDAHLRSINVFYGSDAGVRIIALELAARAAIVDKDLEQFAKDAYADALENGRDDVTHLQQLEQSGDMIERNVSGALTANYRFYRAMVDGGAFDMTEDEILEQAWAQEGDIREDTAAWLMGYLMLSTQPLEEHEMQAYLAFVQTPAGRALNAAIFDGFNAMYGDISYALGRAIALNMVASDL